MKKRVQLQTVTAIILTVLFIVVSFVAPSFIIAGDGIKDSEISLRKSDVLIIPNVPLFQHVAEDAGNNELLPRAWDGAPPQVPHLVSELVVNREENECTDCHTSDKTEDGDPAISISHYTDESGETLVGRRYFCSTCHVTQLNAKPLVRNQFVDF